jgi:hypothetical protein
LYDSGSTAKPLISSSRSLSTVLPLRLSDLQQQQRRQQDVVGHMFVYYSNEWKLQWSQA